MSTTMPSDVVAIREWMEKESYLPQDFDDKLIKKFLHSCYGSLESTKKCIEKLCTTRSLMPEIYTDRDPCSAKIETAFSITNIGSYPAGDQELLIHQIDDPQLEKYSFYDVMKAFTIQSDYWIRNSELLADGHIVIIDIKEYTLKILPKVNIMYFREFLVYILEGMPVRVKQVHAINCATYYEKLFALVKPALPAHIRNLIHFHPSAEGLHSFIDKKYLPKEFGGSAESLVEQNLKQLALIKKEREWFKDDRRWKADLTRKPKNNAADTAMSGSFRTLVID